MLTTLRIKNLALVDDLTVEFGPGYNVITGETGAGKSILIGALTLVLGERADRTLIRNGADACIVEAAFDLSRVEAPIASLLKTNGLESTEHAQLILKRSFTTSGTNRQFINGSPTTLNILAEIGQWLVDIHGPHDHQSLLHPARQLAIVDSYGKLDGTREEFAELLRRRAEVEEKKAALVVDERTYLQQLELLRFQTNEISDAGLEPEEDAQIERDYLRASNSAKLLQLGNASLDLLAENENCLLSQHGALGRTLQDLKRLDPSAQGLLELHDQAGSVLRELQRGLSNYGQHVELDPSRLQQLEERLNLLHSLKRKYGPSLRAVIAFGEESRLKLASLEKRDEELVRLNQDLKQLDGHLVAAGKTLTAKRRKLIQPLSKAITHQLSGLGFKQSRFDISLTTMDERQITQLPQQTTSRGFDTIDFQFAPNPGEALRPLRAIASSGELARVMLALKSVLAAEDKIPVLVFDEVDANVGGETAHAVGEKINAIASKRQVLCITHLPQVAAPASVHFVVTKQLRGSRTVSQIARLQKTERVAELARMLGGQTQAAIKHAEALLDAG
jgi:DNA repair protein RecN (Recombination protein N)